MIQPIDWVGLPKAYASSLQTILNAPGGRPLVVAQLGQSLDGRIALPSGESRWINNTAALDHLHRLRAVVDAVVIGVGTAEADDPMLNVRRVAGPSPVRVVIDPNGRLNPKARLLSDGGTTCYVVTRHGARVPEGASKIEIESSAEDSSTDVISPVKIVEALFERGLKKLLIEGGAKTVSQFIDAAAIDRLHVLLAPCLLGAGATGINLVPPAALAQARRPKTVIHVLEDGDVLFDCDMRS